MTGRTLNRLGASALFVAGMIAASAGLADGRDRSVTLGMNERVVLDREVQRIAVGTPRTLAVEVLSARELLVRGGSVGRTNLLVWYADGSVDEFDWVVQRDVSLLRAVLRDIYPGIVVETAPDRDAIILRGVVPDLRYSQLAEAAAVRYMRAGAGNAGAAVILPADAVGTGAGEGAVGPDPNVPLVEGRVASNGAGGSGVINLLQVGAIPTPLEDRIYDAIAPLGAEDVTVRRIVFGDLPDDDQDAFVLEGQVEEQIALSRILLAASAVVTGGAVANVQVLANESGGLRTGGGGGATGGNSGGGASFGSGGMSSGRSGGGGGMGNQLSANIARATALSAAGGRILAFLQVRDLPQVRVQVRIFEVNRTRLKDWLPSLNAARVDSGQSLQPPLVPGGEGTSGSSPDYGSNTWQMATRIVQGALLSRWEVVAGDFAIDVFLATLESEGIARSLARPTLTVLSGESAVFNVGGAIPIDRTLTTAAGNQSFSDVFFQDFGITLSVRPLVGEGDMITMDVNPDISFPDPALTAALGQDTTDGASTAAFETRTLSTSARLADGQLLAIGGLLHQQRSVDSAFTPGLHSIPGVGWFAKSVGRKRDDTEVVILVSPTIVRDRIEGVGLWAYPSALELLAGLVETTRPFEPVAGNPPGPGGIYQ